MPNSVAMVAQSSPESTLKYSPQYEFVPSGVGVAIGLSNLQHRKSWGLPANTYAAVVATTGGPLVLLGMEKSPNGLLTQMLLSTRVPRLLKH